MLSIFPSLLSYPLVAYFILRITLFLSLSFLAWQRKNKEYKGFSILEGITSIFILIGLFTQVAVLVSVLLTLIEYYLESKKGQNVESKMVKYFMISISISLLLLGPGIFAFDMPL